MSVAWQVVTLVEHDETEAIAESVHVQVGRVVGGDGQRPDGAAAGVASGVAASVSGPG